MNKISLSDKIAITTLFFVGIMWTSLFIKLAWDSNPSNITDIFLYFSFLFILGILPIFLAISILTSGSNEDKE